MADKSKNRSKGTLGVALGVGFVWFTSQFGGGFASGTQLYQYFINFGIWCLVTPALAQLFQAFFQWYALRHAYEHKTVNYRDFCDSFYGRFRVVFSNLYELVYLMLILLAPSIAFATGGSTLHELAGIPYLICTVIVGICIYVIALFDTDMIRRAASVVSYVLIIGVLIVFIPNIIAEWGDITVELYRIWCVSCRIHRSVCSSCPEVYQEESVCIQHGTWLHHQCSCDIGRQFRPSCDRYESETHRLLGLHPAVCPERRTSRSDGAYGFRTDHNRIGFFCSEYDHRICEQSCHRT